MGEAYERGPCRTPTPEMIRAALAALIDCDVIPLHTDKGAALRILDGVETALREAMHAAPWCEHGVADGEYCRPCNEEYKRAAKEQP